MEFSKVEGCAFRRAFLGGLCMSTAATLDNANSKTSLNKVIAISMAAFAVIEAVVAYFLVIGPLYIKPIYAQADAYNAAGTTCIVKLFGKTFASAQELANNQIILSLSSTVLNIALIYIIMTGSVILLSFFFFKGYAFAKDYLVAIFGLKAVVGFTSVIVPFAMMRNRIRIFGVVDAIICLGACAFIVYLNSVEYADDMLFDDKQIADMKKRGINGAVMFGMLTVSAICEAVCMTSLGGAISALGAGNWSLNLGWLNDTGLAQGAVLAIMVAIGLVAAVVYVRDAGWAEYFFFSFGAAAAVTDLIGIIKKVTSTGFGKSTIFLVVAFIAAAALAAFSFTKIAKSLSIKIDAENKKQSMAVLICVGSLILSFIFMIIGNAVYDKQLYSGSPLGAMDFIFFLVYGGLTLFLAVGMLGGYSFTKWGALALYLFVASNAFENVFVVFSARAAYAAQTGLHGYNYMIAGVMYILTFISCLGIIAGFVVKGVDDYLYAKRYH